MGREAAYGVLFAVFAFVILLGLVVYLFAREAPD